MATFHHKEGWSVKGKPETINRLYELMIRLDLFERYAGEYLCNKIQKELELKNEELKKSAGDIRNLLSANQP